MATYAVMFESSSSRYSQACAAAEIHRGAFPLGLPTDGLPRSEAFSQVVHIKGVRVQRELYPRAEFDAALETAAVNGLECYRFLRRSFLGMDHIPIALVPRGSNVIVAHFPAVLSQAADAVMALGQRLYFEIEGGLRCLHEEDGEDDEEHTFGHQPLRGRVSNNSGCSISSGGNIPKPFTPTGLIRTRSGSICGRASRSGSGSDCVHSSGIHGKLITAWMPSCVAEGDDSSGACTIQHAGSLPKRRGSIGSASPCPPSTTAFALQSLSSIKSSASSSFRSLRGVLSARYTSSSRTLLTSSDLDIDISDTRPNSEGPDEDPQVTLVNGGRFMVDKLSVALRVFADREEGVQAFRHELGLRGVRVGEPGGRLVKVVE
ncbi:hypothetical protein VaNZ11_012631 [Volvox africanus]|uniref:Uncharacterized protein n=1 Tax=Volvox africanus TaxID=51714 RepID=A0ABQ5SEI6_9CHLO|nr:hypothetical protein VaNZ11_012631 [Volvox africanus]